MQHAPSTGAYTSCWQLSQPTTVHPDTAWSYNPIHGRLCGTQGNDVLPAGSVTHLGELVVVVWEAQVDAAGVDVDLAADQLVGHCRALDVPACAAGALSHQVTWLLVCASYPSMGTLQGGAPITMYNWLHG